MTLQRLLLSFEAQAQAALELAAGCSAQLSSSSNSAAMPVHMARPMPTAEQRRALRKVVSQPLTPEDSDRQSRV